MVGAKPQAGTKILRQVAAAPLPTTRARVSAVMLISDD